MADGSGSLSGLLKRSAPPHNGSQSHGFTDPQNQVRLKDNMWGSTVCFIWKFSVSGGLGGLPGFQQERIGGGEVQQFAPFGATYCWARIVSEIFVQLIFKYLSKNSLKDICTTTDLRVSVSWQRAAFDGAKPPHACWNKKQAWKSFEFWVKILAGWKANLGFSRKINWYTEKNLKKTFVKRKLIFWCQKWQKIWVYK